jgi:High potential iron-sulfur protein
MPQRTVARRSFIKTLTIGAAVGVWTTSSAHAADAPPAKLDVKDPAAVALGYVENAAQVDTKKYPTYVKGSNCENCLQLQGKPGNNYRPCNLFPGKVVAVSGWCSSWTAEM